MSNFDCMYYERAMPDTFCDYILENLNWAEAANAAVHKGGEDVQFTEWRKAEIISESLMSPLGSIAKNYLIEGNRLGQWTGTICDFDVVQIVRYSEGGHYAWHNDLLPPKDGKQRAVSFVLLLNDPDWFEGGLLQLKDKSDNALKHQGDIVVFGSGLEHRVTPVTRGTRYTAVCWAKTYYEE